MGFRDCLNSKVVPKISMNHINFHCIKTVSSSYNLYFQREDGENPRHHTKLSPPIMFQKHKLGTVAVSALRADNSIIFVNKSRDKVTVINISTITNQRTSETNKYLLPGEHFLQ